MGQQQLLLVILVTIIVGVATVVAINIFGQSAENANLDATRQDVLTIGAMAQGYILKPALLGGGSGKFTGVTLDALGFGYSGTGEYTEEGASEASTSYINANAEFRLNITEDQLTVTAIPVKASKTVTGTITKDDIDITVADAE